MMNRNSILLRRKNKVIVPRGDGSLPLSYTATINKDLESFGYTLSKNVLDALASLSLDDAARFYEEGVAILKEARGVRDYKPMYPSFPRQVMEAPAAELYLNAVLHYLTAWVADVVGVGRGNFIWLPDYEKKPREPLKDGVRLTVIELGTEDDLHRIFSSVISSKASISETDREELKRYFQNYRPALPESIPNKEVLAFVGYVRARSDSGDPAIARADRGGARPGDVGEPALANNLSGVGCTRRGARRIARFGAAHQGRRMEARSDRHRISRALSARTFHYGQRVAEDRDGGALFGARRARSWNRRGSVCAHPVGL